MAKPEKTKEHKFYAINVKLRKRNSKQDLKPEDYVRVFQKVFNEKIHKQSSSSKHCIFRFMQAEKGANKEVLYLTGILVQFTFIENEKWFNLKNMDLDEAFKVPDDLFPDPVQTEFIFVPAAHRFCFKFGAGANLSPNPIKLFLERALNEACKSDEFVQVDLETDHSTIRKIMNAKELKKLKISINYSNLDIGSDIKKFVEDENRKTNLKKIEIVATPKTGESIDLNDSIILSGALQGVPSNGEAEATIINENNKREKIKTSNYPVVLRVKGTISRLFDLTYTRIMSNYRNDGNNKPNKPKS
jgi:hypothetical protein